MGGSINEVRGGRIVKKLSEKFPEFLPVEHRSCNKVGVNDTFSMFVDIN